MAYEALNKGAYVDVAATTDHHAGRLLSPRKEDQGTEDDLLTAALTVVRGAGKARGSRHSSCTSHSLYLGLPSFTAEWLLRVGNKVVAAVAHGLGWGRIQLADVGQPGARRPKQRADSCRYIPRGLVPYNPSQV